MTAIRQTPITPERPFPTPNPDVARYDDLTVEQCRIDAQPQLDRRPTWLRRWLPTSYATARPLRGYPRSRILLAAYH